MAVAKFTSGFARRIVTAVRGAERPHGDMRGKKGAPTVRQPPQQLFAVRVTIDGGAAGSVSTTCSWTYTAELDSGYELGTELTPVKCRLPDVPYESTPASSWGAGFFDKDGDFVLWDANECPQVEDPCPEASEALLGGGGAGFLDGGDATSVYDGALIDAGGAF